MAKWSCGPTGARSGLLLTSVDKGIKKGRISERSGPRVILAALGGGSTKRLQPPRATRYGRKRWCFEENRPLRKPLAAVLVVVWLVLLLTTAGSSGQRSGGMSDSVCEDPGGYRTAP